jgi:hypothetical protein
MPHPVIIVLERPLNDPSFYDVLTASIPLLQKPDIAVNVYEEGPPAHDVRLTQLKALKATLDNVVRATNLSPYFVTTATQHRPHVANMKSLQRGLKAAQTHESDDAAILRICLQLSSLPLVNAEIAFVEMMQQRQISFNSLHYDSAGNMGMQQTNNAQAFATWFHSVLPNPAKGVVFLLCQPPNRDRIAAHVQQLLTVQQPHIKVVSLSLISPYHDKALDITLSLLSQLEQVHDSPAVQHVQTTLNIQQLTVHEKADGSVDPAPLIKLTQHTAAIQVRKSRRNFTIPAWNDAKQKLVVELGGEVIKKDGSNAVIEIESSKLERKHRDTLGIQRTAVTVTSEKLGHLHTEPGITVEPSSLDGTFIATFPADKLARVQRILDMKLSAVERLAAEDAGAQQIRK